MTIEPDPYTPGQTITVGAGFAYAEAATLRPKVQPHTWQIGPGDRADLKMTLVSHRGNDRVKLELSREEAMKLAIALTKLRLEDGL